MKDGGLWILRVHSNGGEGYLIGDKGFDEQESDFVPSRQKDGCW